MAAISYNIKDFMKEIPGENTGSAHIFPTIESAGTKSRVTFWTIRVELMKNGATIPIKADYYNSNTDLGDIVGVIYIDSKIGENGKIKKAAPTFITSGLNLGKINATNVFTQALRDAFSMYNKHLQTTTANVIKYEDVIAFPPMLAKSIDDVDTAEIFVEPAWVQRKYDGVRMVSTMLNSGEPLLYSRKMKKYLGFTYLWPEITEILKYLRDQYGINYYLDGELYHHNWSLQKISGISRNALKNNDPEYSLFYYVYDLFCPASPQLYKSRYDVYSALVLQFAGKLKYIKFVETWPDIKNIAEVYKLSKQFLAEGYEGAMIRLNKLYVYSYNDYHSANLLKVKPVYDAEFEIVDYTASARGKFKDVLMFICRTKSGKIFTINMGMPLEERTQMYKELKNTPGEFEKKYKGKLITVIYDNLSDDGIPVRARTHGLIIRDYE